MKIKTLPQLAAEIRTIDPASAVGESFLTALAHAKEIPHTYHGNRLVADTDTIAPTLNRLLGFEGRNALPHIRTIREAAIEIKEKRPFLGIGEKRIRTAVKDGRIPSIRIGNRDYIAMQSFDEPYCGRILESTLTAVSRAEAVRRDAMEQMTTILVSRPFVPTVTRIRHTG